MSTVLSPSSPSSCSSSGSPHQTSSIIVHMANASHSSASSSFNTTPEHPSPELSVSSSSYVVPPPPSPLHPSSPSPSPTRLLHHAHSPHHPSFSNHDASYYHTQTSIDSSPPPYTETMTSTGSTSTGRLRADSTADSVDSFKPRAENVPFQHHPHYEHHHHHHPHLPSRYEESSSSIAMQSSSYSSRPSSSRDYSTQQTARLPKDEAAYTDHTGKEKKLGHRRVGEDGQITYKRLPSEQIMYSIQLGIGHSIGSLASKPERDVLYNDFNTVETVLFPARGSTSTPAHHFSDFEFTTYTPNAFRHFRDLFRIQPDDYMLSITNEPLMELSNPGASGSVFYRTADDQFIIKTVEKNESKFLLKLLPGYYMNLSQNPLTLLPKFFGLYTYECAGKNIRIIIMNNLLPSTIVMHEKYDLKGSTYKRKASDAEKEKKAPTYKDLDFLERYRLMENFKKSTATLYSKGRRESEEGGAVSFLVPGAGGVGVGVGVGGENAEEAGQGGLQLEGHVYDELVNTLQRDCRVLESFEIMDYSLLIGVHNYDRQVKEHPEKVHFDYEDDTRLPDGAIRATNPQGERLLLFVGIIDILQSYRLFKKVEHAWKALLHDGDTVSVHRPKFYARRFLNFAIKYVFARQSPPAGASRPDKYSYYYTVAENQKKFGFNSLNRSRNGHTFYGAPFR